MIRVAIEYPTVQYDTISFTWHSYKPIPYLKQESFYVKYEDMNIENYSMEVYWQIFLSTMIPIFNLSEEGVELIFPHSIPAYLAETWINYHGAAKVKLSPLNDTVKIEQESQRQSQGQARVGLLYGGGKDSACAFSMFSEVFGVDNIILISFVASHARAYIEKDDLRRKKLLLEPLEKDMNVKVQTVITDLYAIMLDRETAKQIHIAIFMGPALPIIMHYNISILNFSFEFNCFWTSKHETGEKKFYYRRSRPEYCRYISERTNSLFGTDFILTNLNYSFSNLAAFKILTERYPEMIKHLLMCETTTEADIRWCHDCSKCTAFALFCLYCWEDEEQIDISRVLTDSEFIKRALGPEGVLVNFLSTTLALTDSEAVAKRLTPEAYKTFIALRNKYRHMENPVFISFIEPAFDRLELPRDLAERLKVIIKNHCPVIYEVPTYIFNGRFPVDVDYSLICDITKVFNND